MYETMKTDVNSKVMTLHCVSKETIGKNGHFFLSDLILISRKKSIIRRSLVELWPKLDRNTLICSVLLYLPKSHKLELHMAPLCV